MTETPPPYLVPAQTALSRCRAGDAEAAVAYLGCPELAALFAELKTAAALDDAQKVALHALATTVATAEGAAYLAEPDGAALLQTLATGLAHGVPAVRVATARAFGGAVEALGRSDQDLPHPLLAQRLAGSALLPALCHASMNDEDVGASEAAATAVLSLAAVGPSLAVAALSACDEAAGGQGRGHLRRADLMVRVCAQGRPAFDAVRAAGGLDHLHALVFGDDVLVQLNAIDLVERLAATAPGVRYLFESGTVERLLALAGEGGEGDPDPLLGASALRVLGVLCATAAAPGASWAPADGAAVVARFLKAALAHAAAAADGSSYAASHAVASFVASAPAAAAAVLADKDLAVAWLALPYKPEARAARLHAVAAALAGGGSDPRRLELLLAFGSANEKASAMHVLRPLVASPSDEVRRAAMDCVRAACDLGPAGVALVFAHDGFAEWLLDRSTEDSKLGKEWKFSVVEAAMGRRAAALGASGDSDGRAATLAQSVREALEIVLKQGPHFLDASRRPPEVLDAHE